MVARAKLNIDIMVGIPQLKAQMKSVEEISIQMQNRVTEAHEKANRAKMMSDKQLYAANMSLIKKQIVEKEKAAAEEVKASKKANAEIKQEAKKLVNEMEVLKNKELRNNRYLYNEEVKEAKKAAAEKIRAEKEVALQKRFGLIGMGQLAGAAGFHGINHMMTGASLLGVTSTAGILGVGAAVGGIGIISGIVQKAFSEVASAAQNLATSILSSVSTIGGARDLAGMITESANTENIAAHIAANVTDRVSTAEVQDLIKTTSMGSQFNPMEVGAGFSAYKGKTGKFNPLKENGLASFMTDTASLTGMSMDETGSLFGQIQTQFPSLQGDAFKQVIRNLWGLGRAGAVELKDATSITQALGFAGKSGLGLEKGLNFEMGLVQQAQKFTGGQSADQSVTGVRKMQEELLMPSARHYRALKANLGNYISHDETGQAILKDSVDTISKLILMSYTGKDLKGHDNTGILNEMGIDERAKKVLIGAGAQLGETGTLRKGMTIAEQTSAIQDFVHSVIDGTVTIDEFDGKLKNIKDTTEYQLKAAFNDISVQLEGIFLPILRDEVVPELKSFADWFKNPENLADVNTFFKDFVKEGIRLVEMLPTIVSALAQAAVSIYNFLHPNDTGTSEEHLSKAHNNVASLSGQIRAAKLQIKTATESGYIGTEAGSAYESKMNEKLNSLEKQLRDAERNEKYWEKVFGSENPAEHSSLHDNAPLLGSVGLVSPGTFGWKTPELPTQKELDKELAIKAASEKLDKAADKFNTAVDKFAGGSVPGVSDDGRSPDGNK